MNTKVQTKVATYIATFVAFFLGYFLLRDSTWQGSTELHTLMEVAATLLALMVGISALVHFYSKKSNTFLFIGTGFLGTALLDGYHAIVTSQWFDQLWPSPPPHLIPWSWNASRSFLAVLMFLSWWAWRREERLGAAGWISEKTVYSVVGVLTLVSFAFFAFFPLPRAYYPEFVFGRPEEFFAATFFLLALIGYLKKGFWKTDPFEHWVVLSLIVGVMGQAMFMSFSFTLFDTMFDLAHLLKKVSYIFVLTGLLISMYYLFRRAEESAQEIYASKTKLELTNQRLERSLGELSGLYSALTPLAPAESIHEMMDGVIERLMEATGADAALVRLWDKKTGNFAYPTQRGFPSYYMDAASTKPVGSAVEKVFMSGEPIIASDIAADPRLKGKIQLKVGLRSCAFLPLKVAREARGVIHLSSREVGHFSEERKDHLIAIACQMGIALENRDLFNELKASRDGLEKANSDLKRREEAQKLLKELSQDITSLGIDSLLKKLTEKVREFFRVDISDVRMLENWQPMGVSGIEPECVRGSGSMKKRARWIMENRRPLVIADMTEETDIPAGDTTRRLGIRGYLAVPLFSRGGQVIGVLRALTYEPREFTEAEVDLIQHLANGAALALENARLFQETERRAQEQEALNAIAAATSQSLRLDRLLQISLDKVLEITGRERAYIRLKDPETGEITLAAHRGILQEYVEALLHHRTPGGKSDQVFESGEPLIVNDPEGTRLKEEARQEGLRSIAWIPLKARGKVVGIMNVSTSQPSRFEPREVELLLAIGNVIGVALENARLFGEVEKNTFELEEANREIGKANLRLTHLLEEQRALREILTQINLVDMGELLKKIAEHSLNLLKADHVQIRLLDKDGLLRLVAIAGEGAERFQDGLKLGSGRSTWVMENRRPLAIKDISQDKVFGPGHFLRELGVKGYLLLPLISREQKPIGVLGVSTLTEREFTQEEIALAEQFAAGAAIAIENARLYEETQKREDIQKLLKELSQDITSLDIDSLLKKLTDKVRDVVKVDMCDVRVNEKGIWQILGVSGIEAERVRSGATGTARGRSSWIIKNRKVLSIPDITKGTDTPGGESTRRIGVRGYLGVPLFLRGGEVVGVLRAMTYQPRDFSQDEVDLVQQLANGAAIALENARLFQEAEWRAREQAVLNTIAMATSQSLDLNELLQTALDKVLEVTGRDRGYIRLKDSVTGEVTLAAHRGISEEYAQALLYRRTPGGKSDQVFESGEPLVVNDPEGANLKEEARQEGLCSIAWIPLKARGKVVGILNISTSQPRSFEPREVELLQAIGNVIGVGLENARLFEETVKRAEQLSALHSVAGTVSQSLELEVVLDKSIKKVLEVLKFDAARIFLLDLKSNQLEVRAHKNLSEKLSHASPYRLGEGIIGKVWESGEMIAIEDMETDPKYRQLATRRATFQAGFRSQITFPIRVKEKVFGVGNYYCYRPRHFTPEELQLIGSMANQIGVAVENARLFEEVRRKSLEQGALREFLSNLLLLDLDSLLQRLTEQAVSLFKAEIAWVRLFDKQGKLWSRAIAGDEAAISLMPVRAVGELVGRGKWMLDNRKPLTIRDMAKDPGRPYPERFKAADLHGFLGASLFSKDGKPLGVIFVATRSPREFSQREIELIEQFANGAAIAIQNARLFEEVCAGREQLQALSRRLVEVQEIERRRIACELHDEIGQELTGLKLTLEMGTRLPADTLPECLSKANTLVSELITRVRELSLDLRPPMLDDLGLLATLLWHLERYTAQTKVRVIFKHSGLVDRRFPPEVETATYRIVQEALTNVARHAGVSEATVRIWDGRTTLYVQVTDQGTGFDPETALAAGDTSGLAGMRERAKLLGGRLIIESAPGAGSNLTADLPFGSQEDPLENGVQDHEGD
ncbi:MAG: GAF domain-containing protein [Deltaproteobacteria bacterium]|nr:GAF domain-containing protein [Deltaproteobacteria bacterium]